MNEKQVLEEMKDSVVSTRVRLARNVVGVPFPKKMTEQDTEVWNKIFEHLDK